MPIETREDFLNAVTHRMMSNPNSKILVLIDNEVGGMETFFSHDNIIWQLGLLSAAEKLCSIRLTALTAIPVPEAKRAEEEIEAAIKGGKGPAN